MLSNNTLGNNFSKAYFLLITHICAIKDTVAFYIIYFVSILTIMIIVAKKFLLLNLCFGAISTLIIFIWLIIVFYAILLVYTYRKLRMMYDFVEIPCRITYFFINVRSECPYKSKHSNRQNTKDSQYDSF